MLSFTSHEMYSLFKEYMAFLCLIFPYQYDFLSCVSSPSVLHPNNATTSIFMTFGFSSLAVIQYYYIYCVCVWTSLISTACLVEGWLVHATSVLCSLKVCATKQPVYWCPLATTCQIRLWVPVRQIMIFPTPVWLKCNKTNGCISTSFGFTPLPVIIICITWVSPYCVHQYGLLCYIPNNRYFYVLWLLSTTCQHVQLFPSDYRSTLYSVCCYGGLVNLDFPPTNMAWLIA